MRLQLHAVLLHFLKALWQLIILQMIPDQKERCTITIFLQQRICIFIYGSCPIINRNGNTVLRQLYLSIQKILHVLHAQRHIVMLLQILQVCFKVINLQPVSVFRDLTIFPGIEIMIHENRNLFCDRFSGIVSLLCSCYCGFWYIHEGIPYLYTIAFLILYINRIRCFPCYLRQLVSCIILNNIAVFCHDILIKRQIHTSLFDIVFFCLFGYHMISQDVAVIRLQPEILFLHVLCALLVKLQHCPLKDTANLFVFSILLLKQRCFLIHTHRLCII